MVQRVKSASLQADGRDFSSIGPGMVVFLGLEKGDTPGDLDYMAEKILGLRIFSDHEGKMNLSLRDTGGELLLVSQFTLLGDVRRGRRPGFDAALPPAAAQELFAQAVEYFRDLWPRLATGVFGAHMEIQAWNDGPVTILVDSRKGF